MFVSTSKSGVTSVHVIICKRGVAYVSVSSSEGGVASRCVITPEAGMAYSMCLSIPMMEVWPVCVC